MSLKRDRNSPYGVLRRSAWPPPPTSGHNLWPRDHQARVRTSKTCDRAPASLLSATTTAGQRVLLISGRFDEASALRRVERHFARCRGRNARLLRPTPLSDTGRRAQRNLAPRRRSANFSTLYHLPPGRMPTTPRSRSSSPRSPRYQAGACTARWSRPARRAMSTRQPATAPRPVTPIWRDPGKADAA